MEVSGKSTPGFPSTNKIKMEKDNTSLRGFGGGLKESIEGEVCLPQLLRRTWIPFWHTSMGTV